MNNKVEILDSLRAVAALSVCLFHFVCTTTGYFTDETVLSVFGVGKFGVQMFFVISGFVIPWSMYYGGYRLKNFFVFFFKRLARLEPPYVVSVILALGVLFLREKLLGRTNDHIDVSLTQVLLHFGYLIPFFEGYQWLNQVYWTLAVEFQYYLLMAVLFVPLMKAGTVGRIAIYLAMGFSAFLTGSEFLPFWLPLFLMGIILFLFRAGRIRAGEFYSVSIALFVLALYRYAWPVAFFSAVPVIAVLYFPGARWRGFHEVGRFSYSIYLVHPLIGGSLINVLSHRFTQPYEKPLVIMAGVAVTIISSWITYLLVERPSKRLSSSVKYRKASGDGDNPEQLTREAN